MLLLCSFDCSICLWSIINNQCLFRLTLSHTLPINVYFHPINSNSILINFFQNYSILLNQDKNSFKTLIDRSIPSLPIDGWVSTFNHNGEYILTGNLQGKLFIFSTLPSLKFYQLGYIDQHRLCSIKQICLSKDSKYLAILFLDKIPIYEWIYK
jgi:WD40 repeat protein